MTYNNIGAEGVGLAYHPFLHDAILAAGDAIDFVELPLDIYIDPVRAGLLDPSGARLQEIVAAKPCVWHGTALSLGSVESVDDATVDARLVDRVKQLMTLAGATHYSDMIGFRRLGGRDVGQVLRLPYTEPASAWVAARAASVQARLGQPLLLQLCNATLPAPRASWDFVDFLARVASVAGCGCVLDVDDFEATASQETALDRLPGAKITALVTAGESEASWSMLPRLLARTAAHAVIIRRGRGFFPLDSVLGAVRRAGDLLRRRVERQPLTMPPVVPAASPDPAELAALQADQRAFIAYCLDPQGAERPDGLADEPAGAPAALAARVQTWHTWRERLADTHKAQQIAQFLAEDAVRLARQGA
jgi:uncharacterized protein (UPF0276 family)